MSQNADISVGTQVHKANAVKIFKQLALELEIRHSEAMEEAVRMWCDAAIKKVSQP